MKDTSQTTAITLPQLVRDLLASPPQRGEGLNNWIFRVARVLHPYRAAPDIERLIVAVTAGQPIKRGEIERAIRNSSAMARRAGRSSAQSSSPKAWPLINTEQREAIVASGVELVDLWELSPVRFCER